MHDDCYLLFILFILIYSNYQIYYHSLSRVDSFNWMSELQVIILSFYSYSFWHLDFHYFIYASGVFILGHGMITFRPAFIFILDLGGAWFYKVSHLPYGQCVFIFRVVGTWWWAVYFRRGGGGGNPLWPLPTHASGRCRTQVVVVWRSQIYHRTTLADAGGAVLSSKELFYA